MDISTELYKVFYMVAKYKSFSQAASHLYVSQSAVSQSVKSLEERLGFPLLYRTTKEVSLTIDGEILYTHLQQAFSIIESAEHKLKTRQDEKHGQLLIAATDTLCKYYLIPIIKKLTHKYPNIQIKIINGTSVVCLDLLANAKIDFALINFPDKLDTSFVVKKANTFRDVFITSKDSPLPDEMTLEEIAEQPLMVLDKNSVTRKFLDGIFKENNIVIQPDIQLQSVDNLIDMAEIGLGISFVPDLCIKNRKVKVISTQEDIPPRTYGLLALKQLPLTPAAKTFLTFV